MCFFKETIPKHAQYKAIVQEGKTVDTSSGRLRLDSCHALFLQMGFSIIKMKEFFEEVFIRSFP